MTSAGAGGFAKGFASGFVTTFTAAQQRKHEQDQLTLKSRLDQLREDAEARKKKQETESEAISNGKKFSELVGAPDFAAQAAEMYRLGMSTSEIQSQWDEGRWKKKQQTSQEIEVPNPEVTKKMSVPAGVISGIDPATATDNLPLEQAKLAGVSPEEAKDSLVRADEVIRNAGIQTEPMTPVVDEQVRKKVDAKLAQTSGAYEYVAPTKKEKIGTLADEVYRLEEAKRTGDTLLAADQERKVEAIKKAEFIKANQKAQLEGTNVVNYAIVDKNNRLVSFVPTERDNNGNLLNASTENNGRKNPITLGPDQKLIRVNEDQVKQTWNIQEQFAKQSKDYKLSSVSTAEAVSYTRKMDEILQRNPSVTTDIQGVMVFAQGILEEAKALQKVFEQSTLAASENMKEGGDPYKASAAIASMDQKIKELELQKLSLSDKNAQDALDKTLFDNYKTLAAYKLAQANGQSGQAAGEKDIQRFLALVGDKTKNAAAVKLILANQLKEQIAKNDNLMNDLNRDVEQWGPSLGFIPNVSANNLGSLIKDKADREYFMQVLKMKDDAQLQTTMKANEADGIQPTPQKVQVMSKEEYDALPSGTEYIDPKGNPRRKK